MDYRPYILAGTFLLFVVALIAFFATLAAVRRRSVQAKYEAHSRSMSARPVESGVLDTSLEGLEVNVDEDAPSAALLTPLRASEWMPPDTPAPVSLLEQASLAGRGSDYEPVEVVRHADAAAPAPYVPAVAHPGQHLPSSAYIEGLATSQAALVAAEAAASVAQIAAAASAAQAAAAVSAAQAAAAVSALQAATPYAMLPQMSYQPLAAYLGAAASPDAVTQPFPAVCVPAVQAEPVAAAQQASAPANAEAASAAAHAEAQVTPLMPVAPPVPPVSPAPAAPSIAAARVTAPPEAPALLLDDDLSAAIAALADSTQPVGVPVIAAGKWEPPLIGEQSSPPDSGAFSPTTPPVPPVSTPFLDQLDAQMEAHAAEQADRAEQADEADSVPPLMLAEPAPAPETSATMAPEQDWDDLLRQQQQATSRPAPSRPVAVAAPAAPRPAATVATAVVPESPAEEEMLPRPVVRRARPQVRVHVRESQEPEAESTVRLAPLPAIAIGSGTTTARSDAPEIVMEAPVEMWFGESRVGVKAGTSTYQKFRKYADVLFADLKNSERGRE